MGAVEGVQKLRRSRTVIAVVAIMALILDNFLMTIVVPILPVVFVEKCRAGIEDDWRRNQSGTPGGVHGTADGQDGDGGGFDCIEDVNRNLGLLLASQFIIRLVICPFSSYLCEKFGYCWLMLIGCLLSFITTLVYAAADSYLVYLIGRLLHGVASMPTAIGSLGLLGYRFQDDDEKRGFVLGLAICGFAIGAMVGPSFGAVVSYSLGETAAFLFLAAFFVLLGIAEIAIFEHGLTDGQQEDPMAVLRLFTDPFVLIVAGALTIGSIIFGLLEPALPLWMIDTMVIENWQLGVVFLPSGLAYIFSSAFFGYFGYRIGRWLCTFVGMVVMAVCVVLIPIPTSFNGLIAPMTVFGLCFGAVDSMSCAIVGYIVHTRHKGAYGAAATLSTGAFALGFIVGPALSSFLVNYIGFTWVLRGLGVLTGVFAPLCFFLRRADGAPPSGEHEHEDEMGLILPAHKPDIVTYQLT